MLVQLGHDKILTVLQNLSHGFVSIREYDGTQYPRIELTTCLSTRLVFDRVAMSSVYKYKHLPFFQIGYFDSNHRRGGRNIRKCDTKCGNETAGASVDRANRDVSPRWLFRRLAHKMKEPLAESAVSVYTVLSSFVGSVNIIFCCVTYVTVYETRDLALSFSHIFLRFTPWRRSSSPSEIPVEQFLSVKKFQNYEFIRAFG